MPNFAKRGLNKAICTVFYAKKFLLTIGVSHVQKSRHRQTSKNVAVGYECTDSTFDLLALSPICQWAGCFGHFRALAIAITCFK